MIRFFFVRGQVIVLGVLVVLLGILIPRITLHALKTGLEDFHFDRFK